jgi:hypothetical protein
MGMDQLIREKVHMVRSNMVPQARSRGAKNKKISAKVIAFERMPNVDYFAKIF